MDTIVDGRSSPPMPIASQEMAPDRAALPFQFTGSASEYFRIWIVNVALSVVTLGIYSAWAKVRNKQYFYRHTLLDGASFDYRGDPRKILKGRLLVAAALALLAVSEQSSPRLYLLEVSLLLLATPWVLVKALRFNLRNSAWRNVCFSFRGTTRRAYLEYAKGLGLTLITLGLALPWFQWDLTRFKVEGSSFGKLPMRFRSPAIAFFATYWSALLVYGVTFGGVVVGAMILMAPLGGAAAAGSRVFLLAMLPCYFVGFIFAKARLANLVWGGIEVGEHRLASAQRFRHVLCLQTTNVLAIVCTLGLALPWARVRNYRYRLSRLTLNTAGPLVVDAAAADSDDGAVGDAFSDLGDFDIGFS